MAVLGPEVVSVAEVVIEPALEVNEIAPPAPPILPDDVPPVVVITPEIEMDEDPDIVTEPPLAAAVLFPVLFPPVVVIVFVILIVGDVIETAPPTPPAVSQPPAFPPPVLKVPEDEIVPVVELSVIEPPTPAFPPELLPPVVVMLLLNEIPVPAENTTDAPAYSFAVEVGFNVRAHEEFNVILPVALIVKTLDEEVVGTAVIAFEITTLPDCEPAPAVLIVTPLVTNLDSISEYKILAELALGVNTSGVPPLHEPLLVAELLIVISL